MSRPIWGCLKVVYRSGNVLVADHLMPSPRPVAACWAVRAQIESVAVCWLHRALAGRE